MNYPNGVIGLTTYSRRKHPRCERCDLLLEHSKWNGVTVFYSRCVSPVRGFLCVRCALKKKAYSGTKVRVTTEELDIFVENISKTQQKELLTPITI